MGLILSGLPSTVLSDGSQNCTLLSPPADAGETQAHGVILYIYPRSHLIDKSYTGCQSRWFLDDDNYRKLSIIHYEQGVAIKYDNLNIFGGIGYRCKYHNGLPLEGSDRRCPAFGSLRQKTYQAGCYSQSSLNSSDSYDVAFEHCILE